MPITFETSGKPGYMFQEGATSADGIWYSIAGKVDTAASYQFTGVNSFTNDVTFDDSVTATEGFNNFLNPAARDAALATPIRGTIAFVRQDSGGSALNQIQFYDGSAWVGSGDIFGVTAGTGLSGGGTSGTVTVSIDTTVVTDLTTAQTLTNKKLSDSTTTIVDATDATKALKFDVTGTTAVTGTITSAFTTAKTLTLPDATDTLIGKATADTLTNKTLTSPVLTNGSAKDLVIKGTEETINVVASAATGTINFDVDTASIWYYTSNASANHTLNFRYSSSVSLNTALAIGDSITLVWLNTNGGTAYYPSAFTIDGSAVTPKVPAAISSGNTSAIDAYSFTIIKTASATFTVLETQTKFA